MKRIALLIGALFMTACDRAGRDEPGAAPGGLAMPADDRAAALPPPDDVAQKPKFAVVPPLPPGAPRLLAIVGGTLVFEDGCALLRGDETDFLLALPEGTRSGRDRNGFYIDTGTRLYDGDRIVSGGGWVGDGAQYGVDYPGDCAAREAVMMYRPRLDDAARTMPAREPPPPPALEAR